MKQWMPLGIALGVPLLFILGIAGYMRIAESRVNPGYDILYAMNTDYYREPYYYIEGDHLTSTVVNEQGQMIGPVPSKEEDSNEYYRYDMLRNAVQNVRFYRYDPSTDSSASVGGYVEARALRILSIDKSPDGYRVTAGRESGEAFFFPFFFDSGRNGGTFVIEGNGGRKNITLLGDGGYRSISIIGWIAK